MRTKKNQQLVKQAIIRALQRLGDSILDKSQRNVPVDRGTLMRSGYTKKLAGRGAKVMLKNSIQDIAERTGKELINTKKFEEDMTKDFIQYYSENILNKSTLKNGVLNFLKWCKEKSILMGVCTNKQEHLSIDLLKKIKIYHFFEYVAGGNTFEYNKPDPKHLTNTIEILGGNIKKALMIGDSETDAIDSKSANIPFVLIEDGYTIKKKDEIYHEHIVKDFVDMNIIVEKYL